MDVNADIDWQDLATNANVEIKKRSLAFPNFDWTNWQNNEGPWPAPGPGTPGPGSFPRTAPQIPIEFAPQLKTVFKGVVHPYSTTAAPVHQFRGIKFGNLPGRFRQSRLNEQFPAMTDASTHG
jgi:hypothetical protein